LELLRTEVQGTAIHQSVALIIGDPNQLRHITQIASRRDQQLQSKHDLVAREDQPFAYSLNSLFDLAATRVSTGELISLRDHFRSHADIVRFSNRKWYADSLKICTDYRRLKRPSRDVPGVVWTPVRGKATRPASGGMLNVEEADAVVKEVRSLLAEGKFAGTVGVVTPFRAQANRILDMLNQQLDLATIEKSRLQTSTAHGFQGDERDVIFFSPVVAPGMPSGAKHFLGTTANLFNVAITRARALLHVVGDIEACATGISHLEEFTRFVASLANGDSSGAYGLGRGDPARVGPWENVLREALERAGLRPIPQYPEHQYRLDLALVDADRKLDIEVDGEYYHKEWDGSRCRADIYRDIRLNALGWTVKRLWVYEVRDQLDRCVAEVKEVFRQMNQHS
jgi:very-short-patch-repair endonuclease